MKLGVEKDHRHTYIFCILYDFGVEMLKISGKVMFRLCLATFIHRKSILVERNRSVTCRIILYSVSLDMQRTKNAL